MIFVNFIYSINLFRQAIQRAGNLGERRATDDDAKRYLDELLNRIKDLVLQRAKTPLREDPIPAMFKLDQPIRHDSGSMPSIAHSSSVALVIEITIMRGLLSEAQLSGLRVVVGEYLRQTLRNAGMPNLHCIVRVILQDGYEFDILALDEAAVETFSN